MRPRLSTLARVLFAVAVTGYVLWKSEPAAVGNTLRGTSWGWVLAAVALVLADRLLMAQRWIALLAPVETGARPPLGTLVRIFFVSTFLGTFLPASVGGDAVRAWSLKRDGVPGAQSLASVLMDRLLGVISIVLCAAAGLALVPDLLHDRHVGWALAAATAGCIVAVAVVFSNRLDDAVRGWLGRAPRGRVLGAFGRLLTALQTYRRHHALLLLVLTASVGVQLLRIMQAWMLGRSLGIDIPLVAYLVAIPAILLLMLLPITINGLGVSQWAFVFAFARFGVGRPPAFALSVLFVALGLVGNLPGALLYATRRGSRRTVPGDGPRLGGSGRI